MNRIITAAVLAASAVTVPAFADDITPSEPFVSTADRAQVQAGIAQARTVANLWSIAYNPLAAFESGRTREEVRAEYIASRDAMAGLSGYRFDTTCCSASWVRLAASAWPRSASTSATCRS